MFLLGSEYDSGGSYITLADLNQGIWFLKAIIRFQQKMSLLIAYVWLRWERICYKLKMPNFSTKVVISLTQMQYVQSF